MPGGSHRFDLKLISNSYQTHNQTHIKDTDINLTSNMTLRS
jgi:hypothetical protein